ncbi:hypothetical protein KUCAC02_010029 [Chaenocephalus aceratus]|uniref:Uncharacterized protein n=1 Tax=Chaenocephalus aceratus TaxID=36190 RepID=A0ACB9VZ05_CHAAC|nr:hypothetical protein KUCAC02_010029 [Chaenocephalus aceratus]
MSNIMKNKVLPKDGAVMSFQFYLRPPEERVEVFLSVGPPGSAHEEAHLRAEEKGVGERKKHEEEEIGGERDRQWSYQPPASFTPSINQSETTTPAGHPSEGAVKIKRTAGPLIGDGDRRNTRSS